MIKIERWLLAPYIMAASLLFYVLLRLLGLDNLIIVLNGSVIGALLSVTVIYSRVIRSWFFGTRDTDRVSVFGLFYVLLWANIGLSVFNSVYIRAADLDYTALMTTAIYRYCLIYCAWGSIASLDYGEPWFYGRDRKMLYAGVLAGIATAAALIYAQSYQVLAQLTP